MSLGCDRQLSPEGRFSLSSMHFKLAIADQFAALFVPKSKCETFKAGKKRERLNGSEQRLRLMAFFQTVIRNPGAEMMNVMKANIAREPLEHFRKLIEGTALERRGGVFPISAAFPVNV